jgi:hypothetical protein
MNLTSNGKKVNPDAHAQGLQIKVMAKRKLSYFDEKAVL